MHALVTGATGFVGRRLVSKLERPTLLSRDPAKAERQFASAGVRALAWNAEHEPPPAAALDGIDVIFHLAGESVGEGRWTAKKKARIKDSRVLGMRNLVAALRSAPVKPKALISASAIGYYGSAGNSELDERSAPGTDFLAEVCAAWEQEALAAQELGVRVVCVRIGIVLGENGGALAKMLTPFSLGLGSPLGSGQQYMSWVHLDDLVELMLFAARESSLAGPVNGVAPHPVTNREFSATLARVLRRPMFMPSVPPLALKLMLGQFAEVLLASQRVYPRAATAAGFAFRFANIEPALADVLHR